MTDMQKEKPVQAERSLMNKIVVGTVIATASAGAFASDGAVSIDLTTGLAGVAIVAGLMSAGSLKALPTYVAWGIKKALSMLR